MKKFCIIICSLLLATAIAVGTITDSVTYEQFADISLCDLPYGRTSF